MLFKLKKFLLSPEARIHLLANASVNFLNLPVYGGRVHLTVSRESKRVIEFGSDVWPNINISTTPKISESEARNIAKSQVKFNDSTDSIGKLSLLIYPLSCCNYRLVWKVSSLIKRSGDGI